MNEPRHSLHTLSTEIKGEILTDPLTRRLYATDASPYQQLPMAVARPRHTSDCVKIVQYAAAREQISLIPRGAGTSLAGQCVGKGLVVDCSRHMDQIMEIDSAGKLVRVQPGLVLSELNDALRPHRLMFAPDPSTADRCNIGGMLGNNAWGGHALRYGTTRDHVERVEAVLADGSLVEFGPLDENARRQKLSLDSHEGSIYRTVSHIVETHIDTIRACYPTSRGIPNNAGYALDVLARQQPWSEDGPAFNLAPILCGSEGTLALVTEATLRLVPIAPYPTVVCPHFESLQQAIEGVENAVKAGADAVEVLDSNVLSLARSNPDQARTISWVENDPQAILIIEFGGSAEATGEDVRGQCESLVQAYRARKLGYAYPILEPPDSDKVWAMRRAGLGLLMGIAGTRKPVTGMEDSAVAVSDLPAYLNDVKRLMETHGVDCVIYGSASMGLLHLRPFLDLRSTEDKHTFATLMDETASLVARYGGSFSAKHGDGRLRASYLEQTLGEEMVRQLREVKLAFDPNNILNPGKVIDPPPLSADLRYDAKGLTKDLPGTYFWDNTDSLVNASEACHGAGACLKHAGRGTMCPSYMATREELHSTRGRANLLRQALASPDPAGALTTEDLYTALELCLACKGCRAECPANVDIARLKAEFLQHYHDRHGVPWRSRILGRFSEWSRLASKTPRLSNLLLSTRLIKRALNIHPARRLPSLGRQRFSEWFAQRRVRSAAGDGTPILLINDPFTEYYEPEVGRAAVEVFEHLACSVHLTPCISSGRAEISQGLLGPARKAIADALTELYPYAAREIPIVGLEPSEFLTFRDEALTLVRGAKALEQAAAVAKHVLSFEEALLRFAREGRIASKRFNSSPATLLVHVHCHQKSLAGIQPTLDAFGLIPNTEIRAIPSGCCGMAGAFGYEREHFELSQQIGELVLLPAVRAAPADALVVATGTSCRHQILDATRRKASHPAQIFRSLLNGSL